MNERSYWNSNGEAQALYDEMQAAAFKYTKATGALFHSYHRYYNDGDLPGWARSRPDMTRYSLEYGYGHSVLTAAGDLSGASPNESKSSTAAFKKPGGPPPDERRLATGRNRHSRSREAARFPNREGGTHHGRFHLLDL